MNQTYTKLPEAEDDGKCFIGIQLDKGNFKIISSSMAETLEKCYRLAKERRDLPCCCLPIHEGPEAVQKKFHEFLSKNGIDEQQARFIIMFLLPRIFESIFEKINHVLSEEKAKEKAAASSQVGDGAASVQ